MRICSDDAALLSKVAFRCEVLPRQDTRQVLLDRG
jgi:hypothetical protein